MPKVRDRMTSDVVSIQPGTSVRDAARTMIQKEKGPLPIVEGDRPVAIVTDRDLVAHVLAEGRDPDSTTVDDVASRDLATIEPDKDVDEARQLMSQRELDRILVTQGGRLVGIISEADIRGEEGPLA
jgi:CBS domain-containing protein